MNKFKKLFLLILILFSAMYLFAGVAIRVDPGGPYPPGKYKMTCLWGAFNEDGGEKWNEVNTAEVTRNGTTFTEPNGKAVLQIYTLLNTKVSEQDAPGKLSGQSVFDSY